MIIFSIQMDLEDFKKCVIGLGNMKPLLFV